MKVEDVRRTSPEARFLYWCRERHAVYLRKELGRPKPWTDDEVLRNYFFTNPYRENDKVTKWFRREVRDPLRDDPRVLFATISFRWFNLPETGELLIGGEMDPSWMNDNLLLDWDRDDAFCRLDGVRRTGGKVFTGAYMINSPPGEPKLEAIVRRVTNVWEDRENLLRNWRETAAAKTMEGFHSLLECYDGLGGFMAYEVVCDLRWTTFLRDAPDKLTWCNPGPGCVRGLYRLAGEDWAGKGNNASSPPRPKDWLERMKRLLAVCWVRLPKMPRFEMREVEHSLCEFDKYERLLWGDGKAKRRYNGGPP